MICVIVLLLVTLGATDVTAVGDIAASAKGTAVCNYHGFDQLPRENGNVSIIHRTYPTIGPHSSPLIELVLATVPVEKGEYTVRAIGKGIYFGPGVNLFLRLKFTCAGLAGVKEVQIPDDFVARIPHEIVTNIPPKFFQHDFDIYFDGP